MNTYTLCRDTGKLCPDGVCPEHGPDHNCVTEYTAEPRKASELQQENRILRGLVQTNPEWKCPYGYNAKPAMGFCPLGFPGCACADDRLSILCEDEERVLQGMRERIGELRARLAAFQVENLSLGRIVTALDTPAWVREELGPTLDSCRCTTCQAVKGAANHYDAQRRAIIETAAAEVIGELRAKARAAAAARESGDGGASE